MPKLTIDGMEVEVENGTSVLQAAEQLGIEIPRFCYHDKLSVPANCRMCLVEVEGAPKPMASCAMSCAPDMVVHTGSEKVHKARKAVMEFLLINHPLDCPICDQGGECDLQDQSVAYGYDSSRYDEPKRAVKDKDLGPLVKTVMTRCIHCTRCVRFSDEIAGVPVMGLLQRGEDTEISNCLGETVNSEMSGNLVDICPVGALTAKPYEFNARPWELSQTDAIDVMDAVGSNISLCTRSGAIIRIQPRMNEDINEVWIADKTRYIYDGLKKNRLDKSYVRNAKGKLEAVNWEDAFEAISNKFKTSEKIGAIAGDMADVESMFALKGLMNEFESNNLDYRQRGENYDISNPAGYRFNTTIAGLEESDLILLIGTNPRIEAAMVNSRIRKTVFNNGTKVALIGEKADLNYDYDYLGNELSLLEELASGKGSIAKQLKAAEKPVIILGASALNRKDGSAIHNLVYKIAEKFKIVTKDWNGFNMLHQNASTMGALEIGFTPSKKGLDTAGMLKANMDILYLLGADDLDFSKLDKDTFVIYQGSHGGEGAKHADVILPASAYTEKHAIYMNLEARPQTSRQAVFPVGEAKADWKIIRALSEYLDKKLPYDDLLELRDSLRKTSEVFDNIGEVIPVEWSEFGKTGKINKTGLSVDIDNYYQTNIIARSSDTMSECVDAFINKDDKKVA